MRYEPTGVFMTQIFGSELRIFLNLRFGLVEANLDRVILKVGEMLPEPLSQRPALDLRYKNETPLALGSPTRYKRRVLTILVSLRPLSDCQLREQLITFNNFFF